MAGLGAGGLALAPPTGNPTETGGVMALVGGEGSVAGTEA